MRDPRFSEDAYFTFQADRRRKAEEIAVPPTDLALIKEQLAASWASSETSDGAAVATTFEARVEKVGPEAGALVVAVKHVLRERTPDPDALHDRASLIVGEVLGRSVASGVSSMGAIDRARRVVSGEQLAPIAFDEAFVETCLATPDLAARWCAELASVPADLGSYVASYERRELPEEYARQPYRRPADVWHDRGLFVPIGDSVAHRLWLLRDLSLAKLLEALERIPFPPIRRAVMEYLQLYQDRDLLLAALAVAPAAYVNDEWTGNVTPFLIVEEIVEHAIRLSEVVERSERTAHSVVVISGGEHVASAPLTFLRESELPEWLRRAFDDVVRRPDGRRLAVELAVELVRRTSHRRTVGREPSWDGATIARDVLVDKLVESAVDGGAIRSACRHTAAGDAAFSEMAYVVLLALLEHSRARSAAAPDTAQANSRDAWDWYETRLRQADDELAAHLNPYGPAQDWVFAVLGSSLFRNADPGATWLKIWNSLFSQRQRARFERGDFHAMDSSRHVLRAGMYGFLTVPTGEISDAQREVWRLLRTRAEHLLLSDVARFQDELPEFCRLFTFVPHVLGEKWPNAISESGDLFRTYDDVCLLSAYLLALNGPSPQAVRKTYTEVGCDPVQAGVRMRTWIRATNQENRTKVDIAACLRLLEKIEEPSAPVSPPGTG